MSEQTPDPGTVSGEITITASATVTHPDGTTADDEENLT